MQNSVRISGREGVDGHVARLRVSKRHSSMPAEPPTPTAALGAFVEDVYLHLTVSLQLSPESFSQLKAEMSGTSALALDARFKTADYRAIRIEAGKEFASVELVDVSFTFFEEATGLEDAARRSLSRHLSSSLSSESLGSTSSQLAFTAAEMCEQAARTADLRSVDIETLTYSSVGILRKARSAFLSYTSMDDGDHHLLSMKPGEFTASIAALEDGKRQKLQTRYTTLWKHFSINDVVTRGQAKAGAQAEGMTYEVDELEALARLIVKLPHLHSKTLAWAVTNALVYAECLAFAQLVAPGQTIAGIPVAGELQGLSPGKAWRKAVWKSTTTAIFEVFKIGATFIIASVLTSNEPLATWVVTTGVTAARWVRNAIGVGKSPEVVRAELLLKMVHAHETLRRGDFHAGLARSEIMAAAALGAVFSPWVLHLLDEREKTAHMGEFA
ncbi:hypothetical protein ACWKW4_19890 [Hydrogenophaga borbori]